MKVDDNLRERINSARRQNYSDDEIVGVLAKRFPEVQTALDEGFRSSEILGRIAPEPTMLEKANRMVGVAARGATEALAPMAGGALVGGLLGGPPGAALGAVTAPLVVPLGDVLVEGSNRFLGTNLERPSQTISEMIPGPRAETPTERVAETVGSALAGTAGGVGAARQLARMPTVSPTGTGVVTPGQQAIGQELSRAPVGQITTVPVAAGAGQVVTEDTENPFLGLGASLMTASAMGLQPGKFETTSPQKVLDRAKENYKIMDESGFKLGLTRFNQAMTKAAQDLRQEGYDPRTMPNVAVALDQMISSRPKTAQELMTVRKFIQKAANSADKDERRIAKTLMDDYDDYIVNAKPNQIVSGTQEASQAWANARNEYMKFKKSEIFANMLKNAEVSASPPEVFLKNQISSLAKNEKRMRFFSKEEQAAIRKAATDDTLQNQLRLVAKFTPMTPAAAIFTAVSPFGAYTAAAGLTAKELATKRRFRQLEQLQNQMLLGRQPKQLEGPFRNLPVYTGRAGLNMLAPVVGQQDSENALAR